MNSITGIRILFAEDNVLNQKIVTLMLQKLGAECRSVLNGQEAIEALKKEEFDLILMDMNMPVMDGHETASYIRNTIGSKIPIIAFTADSFFADDPSNVKDGIDAILMKPFEFDYFSELAVKLINRKNNQH